MSKTVIIDVRTAAEYEMGHAENSINIDFYSPHFIQDIQKLSKDEDYKLYCRTGNRSGQAVALMTQVGFKKVENIGGLDQASSIYKFI